MKKASDKTEFPREFRRSLLSEINRISVLTFIILLLLALVLIFQCWRQPSALPCSLLRVFYSPAAVQAVPGIVPRDVRLREAAKAQRQRTLAAKKSRKTVAKKEKPHKPAPKNPKEAFLFRYRTALEQFYKRGIQKDSALRGFTTLRLKLSDNGSVQSVRFVRSRWSNPSIGRQVEADIRAAALEWTVVWSLAPPKSLEIPLRFPLKSS